MASSAAGNNDDFLFGETLDIALDLVLNYEDFEDIFDTEVQSAVNKVGISCLAVVSGRFQARALRRKIACRTITRFFYMKTWFQFQPAVSYFSVYFQPKVFLFFLSFSLSNFLSIYVY